MSAIYQRARPIRWDQVVGQEHVKDVLRAALEAGRVGHAYLFSGPRGVGKTTTARLIAMTANCAGPDPKPCGECESCLSVRAGSHPDVMEIDAASNNGVDDVRELRELVGLAAMRGGKKIYILDEAHMMTKSAFNALLKTLEEPPGHVIFILATTEPEKIIPTILSRCQHYRFRRHTPEEIAGKLAGLAAQEGMTADADALNLIGRLADGAMRDGESLLERMLAAGTAVTRAAVEQALGLPPGERVRAVASALVVGDAGAALQGVGQLYRDGFAARTVVEGLVSALGAALHAELGLGEEGRLEGADVPRLLKLQAALDEQEARFARSADGQSLELALTHALLAADSGGSGGGGVTAGGGAAAMPADLAQRLGRLEKELATLRAGGGAVPAPERRGPAPASEVVREAVEALPLPTGTPGPGELPPAAQGNWADVVRAASMQLRAFLKPARMHAEAGYISLTYDDKNAFHAKQALNKFEEIAVLALKVFGPVTFELIAPEGRRKQKLGGSAGNAGVGEPAGPTAPLSPAVSRPPPTPAAQIEIAPFEPAPRRASREAGEAGPPASAPSVVPASAAQRSAAQRSAAPLPASQATPLQTALPPRPAAVATLEPPTSVPPPRPQTRPAESRPETRLARPASPDDVAPAPLPAANPDPWQADHVADAPPPPAEARAPAREPYIVAAISEEPDWDDIGGPVDAEAAPSLADVPSAGLSVERPAPAPVPTRPAARAATAAAPRQASAAPSRPGDIRAHPMYEEIKGRFSGRVREIGKNRNPAAPAPDTDDADEDLEA